jgi:hypothetical protein
LILRKIAIPRSKIECFYLKKILMEEGKMPKGGILGCESTTRDMDCVMIGCFGNLRGRQGMFERYTEEDPPALGIPRFADCGRHPPVSR